MSEVSKVKIAFAGVGDMGQMGHLKNCATLPECEVVALCELRAGLRATVATRYGGHAPARQLRIWPRRADSMR